MILKHAMDSAVVSGCSWSMVKTLKSMRRDLVKHFQSQAQRWANGRYAMEAVEPATAYHGFFFMVWNPPQKWDGFNGFGYVLPSHYN